MAKDFYETIIARGGFAGEYLPITEADFATAPSGAYVPGESGVSRVVANRTVQLLQDSPIHIRTFQTSDATLQVPSGLLPVGIAPNDSSDAQNGRFYYIRNDVTATGGIVLQTSTGFFLATIQPGDVAIAVHGNADDWDVKIITSTPVAVNSTTLTILTEGEQGEEGQMGPPGPTGPAGSTGPTGSQGETGPAVFLDAEQGEEGQMGPPGVEGPRGLSGALAVGFQYKADTTSIVNGDPGPGDIRWDNFIQALATELYIDNLDGSGTDLSILFGILAPGDRLRIQEQDNANQYQDWEITSVTGLVGFFKFGVTLLGAAGGNFSNNERLALVFLRRGPQGSTGAQGEVGPAVYLDAEPGEEGQPGAPGPQGTKGDTGSQGETGPAVFLDAEQGEEGQPGVPGAKGDTGSQGETGPAVFLDAEPGEDGPMGPPGPKGDTGSTGSQGETGPAVFLEADPGEEGQPGVPGTPGSKGDTGSQGETGPAVFLESEQGEEGPMGPPGPTGADGRQGVDGAPGQMVFMEPEQGEEGPMGPPGPPSKTPPGRAFAFFSG